MRLILLTLVVISLAACGGSELTSKKSSSVSGPAVEPVLLADNPTCQDLGYDFGIKFDNVNGPFDYTLTSGDGYLSVHGTSTDGTYFSFTSNVGVDVVLVKGGNAANAYYYSPESTGDSGLVSPDNASGGPAAISHVTICYDYEVQVSKTASTSFDRDFDWSIAKTSSTTTLLLSTGQVQPVSYSVTVSGAGSTDSNFAVSGTITISNPAPIAATLTGLTDEMGDIAGSISCPVSLPAQLEPGASLTCTYSAPLPDATSRTNVATATTEGPVGGNSGQASVDFAGAAINKIDDCIEITDSMVGSLGTVCQADLPKTITYSAEIGPFGAEACDTTVSADNTASFSAPSGETGSASHSIAVTIACAQGCTLTQGYWKTHSSYGPAKYDDTWALLANGADTAFFGTGMTWYQILWTAPQGSAYIILAHQWAAATLSILNGADGSAVAAQLAAAQTLLSTYTPSTLPNNKRNTALQLAYTLDQYNNGLIGPGHCSE